MKHLLSLTLLVCALPVAAEELSTVEPESVGLSAERLSRIGPVIEAYIAADRFPGAVALVERKGKIAYLEHWGTAAPDSIFRIYSMTKPIVSVAVMILHEEGRFLLSDPVSKFIPELAEPEVLVEVDMGSLDETRSIAESAEREITIRDLLRHTSGYTYGIFGDSAVDKLYQESQPFDFNDSLSDMVVKLAELPLKHHPGTVWNYSVSTDVLGRLIEVVSGKPLDAYLEEAVLGPLAMVDTGFGVPDTERDRVAALYRDGKPATGGTDVAERQVMLSGGAGLVSTVSDYLRFCRMLLNDGELDGTRILSRKSVEAMTTDQLGGADRSALAQGYGFGFGFAVAGEGLGQLGSAGEFSWGGLAGTAFFIDPAEEMIGVFMIQSLNDGVPRQQFKALAYQAIVD